MSKLIKSSPAYIDKDRAGQLLEKWGKVLDFQSDGVAPIQNDNTRLNTAILMENQQRWCLGEANVAGAGGPLGTWSGGFNPPSNAYSTDSYAAGDYRLPKVLIPMIRRTFPELITNEIVGVQPMSGPVGLAFAIRYFYEQQSLGGAVGATNYTDNAYNNAVPGAVAPARWPSTASFQMAPTGHKELGWNFLDTRFSGTSSAQLSGNADFAVMEQDTGVAEVLRLYEMTGQIPTVEIRFEKTAVEAGTRRIAGKWSVELEQDLRNMNGIDIDNELTNAMSYEIQAEIDREMIIRMIQTCLNAGGSPNFQGYSFWAAISADARWLGERNRDLYAKIIVEANRIAVRNRRGAANFVIATPRVCAILEMLPEFKFMPMNSTVNTQPVGIAKVGTVGGRFTLYRDTRTEAQNPWIQSPITAQRAAPGVEYALLGYKGAEYYDTGIVYCPYIPVMIQRTIGPNDFSPRVGIMTRYGVVDNLFGASLYYHLIIVQGLGQSFAPGTAHTYL